MKQYDITIIGGGPSGIALAMMLQKTGKSILLLEKERVIGGCWRVEWQDDKYYTEHSPHIITSEYRKFFALCKVLGIKNEFKKTYKYHNALFSIYVSNNVVGNFYFSDIIRLIVGLIISRFIENKQTVAEFSEHLSDKAQKALYMIAVTAASTPDRVMMQDLFDDMQNIPPNIQQLKNPELWIKSAEAYFNDVTNVDLVLNAPVDSIRQNVDKTSFMINDTIETHKCILALPPVAIANILENSSKSIRDNWLPFDKFKQWAYGSYYASIGFQLHFDKCVKYSDEWCWSCKGEWNIIILPMSKYLDNFSKDSTIKTVWSCTLIDQNNYSSYLKKKIHQCSIEEITNEVLRQIRVPKPKKVTFYDGLYKDKGYYMSKDTGFIRQKYGTIPYQGDLSNIHIVSTVNKKGIITMEKAIESCYEYIAKFYPGYEKILGNANDLRLIGFFIVICIAILLYYKYSKFRQIF